MTDDHNWVARLLAGAGPATMPDDVAQRLDRTLRREAASTSADPATREVPPPRAEDVSSVTPPAAVAPGAVPPGAVPPAVVPPSAVPPPASRSATGSPPRLRSVTTGGGSSDDPGDGTEPAPGWTGSGGGSSRRDLHDEDDSERRRRALVRWAPVAAGVLVLGGAGVAVGALFGGGAEDATLADSAESADSAGAGAAMEAAGPPRSLLATGTEYSTADRAAFDAQVRELVALAAADPGAAAAEPEAMSADEAAPSLESDAGTAAGSAPAESAPTDSGALPASPSQARAAAEDSPLADPQVLAECVEAVTSGTSSRAAAVDLAVVDGLESTLLVVPDAAGLTYQVYVVGAGCSDLDTRFDFLTVTP